MKKKLIVTICVLFVFCIIICLIPKRPILIIGNTYTDGKNIDVVIKLNNKDTLYDGTLNATGFLHLIEKREMKIGVYKITANIKSTNEELHAHFFYFFQNVVWIDFDMKDGFSLLVTTNYGQYMM